MEQPCRIADDSKKRKHDLHTALVDFVYIIYISLSFSRSLSLSLSFFNKYVCLERDITHIVERINRLRLGMCSLMLGNVLITFEFIGMG